MYLYLMGAEYWYQVLVRLASVTNALLVNAGKWLQLTGTCDLGKKNPDRKPWPSRLGFGHGASHLMEKGNSMNPGCNGCSKMACQPSDEVFNNWTDGVRTTMGDSQKGTHTPTKWLADPETKNKMG